MEFGVRRNYQSAQLSEVVLPFQKYKMEEVFMSKDPEDLLTVSNATEASKGLERQEPTALETVGATHTCLPVQRQLVM